MREVDKVVVGCLIGFGILGFLLLMSRSGPKPITEPYLVPLRMRPHSVENTTTEPYPAPMKMRPRSYVNEETWDIDWTEDGLPKRVTIHRNATES